MIEALIKNGGDKSICFGDLNDILWEHEKKGDRVDRLVNSCGGVKLSICVGLWILVFEGYPYTWSNGRRDPENVQCRLDRSLATNSFINIFTPIKVYHLSRSVSDHAAIRITLEAEYVSLNSRVNISHLFRFKEA